MAINITINKTHNIHDLVKKLFMQIALMILLFVIVINIAIKKTFGIHDSLKNYSCYNAFNRENINTFNVLTFIQVRTDKNKVMQTKNGQG